MYFHLILTDDCNLCCSYCRAKAFLDLEESEGERAVEIDEDIPLNLEFNLKTLYKFLEKDPSLTLTFYGGEPLLRADLIERIVSEASTVKQFMMQTNGLLLDSLSPEITNRFTTILVSLDGPRELTDANRGTGVYDRVMENVRRVRADGFRGELIARMTVTEKTDIVEAVHWLAENPDHPFASIHWQLDANFTGDFSQRRFADWADGSYNPGIRTLVRDWVDHMESAGEILRWYPFLDPMDDLLNDRPSRLRCGSGHANYSIMTDGHIAPCPVMIGMKQYYVGHIRDADPCRLDRIEVGGECLNCNIRSFCGGRCLYSNIIRPWGETGRRLVCGTVENLQAVLTGALPRVRSLIKEGTITAEDFKHEKFNGCEIIP
ncbi:MAG: TIGR04084 family radical SAM/SPASM domain-containing protein [Methanoregula sp.]|jgi:putative peptide-modifying radical SAM enzyme|uniref:TIGR04084 family radical SAM/SPASM domain-containing protein n=1 Tax=Methanoregula sp. TaxID=2052170 RepID=UPI0025DAD586|nr:TIGR04084 family radical SAM/SPASM domain-containing protein [Methanoregula sp.]MCK9631167.1 TIGR04084 family radical SAM/SPASM domain-containing protein [Methanoregula sp.]